MDEAQRTLLKRILASRQFSSADSLRRILQYLCERAWESPEAHPKEYDIAVNALGRPPSFDPKIDPIVRVSIASVRERLHAFYEGEGRHEPLRLTIPKGQYRAVFARGAATLSAEGAEARSPALETFWRPYLTGRRENILIFTELLFFRNDAGNFVRNIFVNDLRGGAEEMKARLAGEDFDGYKPTFHFVSAGEMHCLLALVRAFAALGVKLETKNSRFSSWNLLRQANLILLGSSRTNSFLDSLQGGNNFVITADRIENTRPLTGEEAAYRGSRFTDGKLDKLTEYAVVTRRPSLTPGCAVTTITANHGRAIEGAGDFLTTENQVQSLLAHMNLGRDVAMPDHFQVVLRVDMIDFDEEVVEVEYVTHRVIEH
jgi:hypothetical protein